jgi:hypothetical protein
LFRCLSANTPAFASRRTPKVLLLGRRMPGHRSSIHAHGSNILTRCQNCLFSGHFRWWYHTYFQQKRILTECFITVAIVTAGNQYSLNYQGSRVIGCLQPCKPPRKPRPACVLSRKRSGRVRSCLEFLFFIFLHATHTGIVSLGLASHNRQGISRTRQIAFVAMSRFAAGPGDISLGGTVVYGQPFSSRCVHSFSLFS